MTCINQQVVKLMKDLNTYGLEAAAAKAGMSSKTARKYIGQGKLPSQLKKPHAWKTHPDHFDEAWPELESFLKYSPGLQAKTLLGWLIDKNSERYQEGHLRTLQRRLKIWRATEGPEKEVMFAQIHQPGRQSQSDYTVMNSLNITILREPFNHLLFHFMLVYSRWETVSICFRETFDSLSEGYEEAVWKLGAVAGEHRTDNLSAATHQLGSSREFNDKWEALLKHYGVTPSRNNPGISHENGSIEKSHHLINTDIDQRLMLRGSRDFSSEDNYADFLKQVLKERNAGRTQALAQERMHLKSLPDQRFGNTVTIRARVTPESTIRINSAIYSVPSRLISEWVNVHVGSSQLKVYYGQKHIQTMPLIASGYQINYRHIVNQLLRKPGAFEGYKYQASLFPTATWRKAYDLLMMVSPAKGHKHYLKILQLAAVGSETEVTTALELLLNNGDIPDPEAVQSLVELPKSTTSPQVYVLPPQLKDYDQLLEVMHVQ